MKRTELEKMPLDDLWALHLRLSGILASKMTAEKRTLEERLSRLTSTSLPDGEQRTAERKPYPIVLPKFRNPVEPFQTWAGRGKQPSWLIKQLKSGHRIDDFRIQQAAQ